MKKGGDIFLDLARLTMVYYARFSTLPSLVVCVHAFSFDTAMIVNKEILLTDIVEELTHELHLLDLRVFISPIQLYAQHQHFAFSLLLLTMEAMSIFRIPNLLVAQRMN